MSHATHTNESCCTHEGVSENAECDAQMRSYGNSELLEITKEDFDRHIKPNFPDVYKAITEMALSRLTGPGSKEALMAMRRCYFSKVNFCIASLGVG